MAKKKARRKASASVKTSSGKARPRGPAMDNTGKLQTLRALTAVYDAVARAASAARREGWPEEAEILEHWFEGLGDEIDRLRGSVLATWKGDAERLTTTVRGLNEEIEESIKELEASQNTAEAAVNVARKVDAAIKAAAKLIA